MISNQGHQENQVNHNFQNPNFGNNSSNSSNTDLVGNKNSTVKKAKKHEYAQIRINLDSFLAALKLKKNAFN